MNSIYEDVERYICGEVEGIAITLYIVWNNATIEDGFFMLFSDLFCASI